MAVTALLFDLDDTLWEPRRVPFVTRGQEAVNDLWRTVRTDGCHDT